VLASILAALYQDPKVLIVPQWTVASAAYVSIASAGRAFGYIEALPLLRGRCLVSPCSLERSELRNQGHEALT